VLVGASGADVTTRRIDLFFGDWTELKSYIRIVPRPARADRIWRRPPATT